MYEQGRLSDFPSSQITYFKMGACADGHSVTSGSQIELGPLRRQFLAQSRALVATLFQLFVDERLISSLYSCSNQAGCDRVVSSDRPNEISTLLSAVN